jgi:uncharacterized membrane protein
MAESRVGRGLLVLLALAYPLTVYLCLGRLEPRWMALLLVAFALVRLCTSRTAGAWAMAAVALSLAAFAWFGNAWLPLKLYPVAINALMLVLFAGSLVFPPSAVERFARLREPDLPPEGVAYTRRVTWAWSLFFVVNGSIALITALWASTAIWTLYNGLIAYCLMALMAGGEWLVRRRVRGRIDLQRSCVERAAHG